MGGFFDFLKRNEFYAESPADVQRLNTRYLHLIAPFRADLKGARVLDIAAHDGRWSFALAEAGAAEVLGIEARAELTARFARYPDTAGKARVRLEVADLYEALDRLTAAGERFDVVALYGIFYHVMDHFRILTQLRRLGPRLVIVDSEFMTANNPVIQLVKERTDNVLNAAPQIEGQEVALKGIPSFLALERMAEALDYSIDWQDWDSLPEAERTGVNDYFRDGRMRRATCALRPL